jgi:hypothetical protein
LAIPFSLTLAPDASAETVAQTARKWGLIGPWSRDCSLKPGKDKNTLLMKQPDGAMRTMYNHDQKDQYSIRDGKSPPTATQRRLCINASRERPARRARAKRC